VFDMMRNWYFQMFTFRRRSLAVAMLPWAGADFAVLSLFAGVFLLTIREGYEPADRADARLRLGVRVAAVAPAIALLLAQTQSWFYMNWVWSGPTSSPPRWFGWMETGVLILATVACAPLPLLLFYRLRGLAKRARSAHLAEHCIIVGVGVSLSLLYLAAAWIVFMHGDDWFGDNWTNRSNVSGRRARPLHVGNVVLALGAVPDGAFRDRVRSRGAEAASGMAGGGPRG